MSAEAQLLFLVAIMAIFWLLMIRPARKAQRAQAELLSSLQVDDEVVLNSGIFGRLTALEDATVQIEVAPGTVLKVARQVVVRRIEDEPADESDVTSADEAAQPKSAPNAIEEN